MSDTAPDPLQIEVVGARVHHLKNLNVQIPLGKWTCLTGVSGAGKSSLAFETVHAEGQRRYMETLSPSARLFLDQIDRPDVDRIDHLPPSIAVRPQSLRGTVRSTVAEATEILNLLALLTPVIGHQYCPACDLPVSIDSVETISRQISGWPGGTKLQIAVPLLHTRPIKESITDLKQAWENNGFHRFWDLSKPDRQQAPALLNDVESLVLVDRLVVGQTTEERLAESLEQAFAVGNLQCFVLQEVSPNTAEQTAGIQLSDDRGRKWILHSFSGERRCRSCLQLQPELEPAIFRRHSPQGACPECAGRGEQPADSKLKGTAVTCPACHGLGLNAVARKVRFPVSEEISPRENTLLPLEQLLTHSIAALARSTPALKSAGPAGQSLQEVLSELDQRLTQLQAVGLGSLALDRVVRTLSAGERQRLTLINAVCSQLVHTLYVLDEPAQGLHPADCQPIRKLIEQLRDQNNTVLMVEHQPELIQAVDHIIDLGPGAGSEGGEVIFAGPYSKLLKQKSSLTGRWLAGQEQPPEFIKRPLDGQTNFLEATGINCHYLQNVTVRFPLQYFSVITGVSGSGKTSLLCDTLAPALHRQLKTESAGSSENTGRQIGQLQRLEGWQAINDCVLVNDVSIAASSRSAVITYLKAFDEIRKLFAETVDAQARGYTPTRFSFNSPQGGRCTRCAGTGGIELDLHFLGSSTITCPDCKGKRYNAETLDIKYRQRNIHDVLTMTCDEAFTFFRNHSGLQRKLQSLRDVGLGYVPLGQSTAALSDGELQRLKLASFLTTATGKHILYLFDEPASGLHPADVVTLVSCFRRLVEQGHSVIAIDHHPLMIGAGDWIVDLGPGAAEQGGQILFAGPLEEFSNCEQSPTAQYCFRLNHKK